MKSINLKQLVYFIAVVALLIFLHLTRISAPFESAITQIFKPIASGFYSVGYSLRHFYQGRLDKQKLTDLAEQLENDNRQLTVENARLNDLEEENKILREYVGFLDKQENRHLITNIIARGDLDNLSQTITIDKGRADGLSEGLALVNGQGIVVGKITQTAGRIAEACLTTSSRCQLAATIQNDSRTLGIARGQLNLTISMEFIPQSEVVTVGDIVTTSGLEKDIPRGLVIGRVKEVRKESNELWQSAVIEPLVNPDDLLIISALLPAR